MGSCFSSFFGVLLVFTSVGVGRAWRRGGVGRGVDVTNVLLLTTLNVRTGGCAIGSPSNGLIIGITYRKNGTSCAMSCGNGRVLKASTLNLITGCNSFSGGLAVNVLGNKRIGPLTCGVAHVGGDSVRGSIISTAVNFLGDGGSSVALRLRMDGGSVTCGCRVVHPGGSGPGSIVVCGRIDKFGFPRGAAAFLYPRVAPVAN